MAALGDVVPKTAEGRIAASVVMLLGIGLFSAITAIITSVLVTSRQSKPDRIDPITAIERLSALASAGDISESDFAAKPAELLGRI